LYTGRRNQLSRFEGWGLLVLFLKSFWGKSSVCPGECEIEMLFLVLVSAVSFVVKTVLWMLSF